MSDQRTPEAIKTALEDMVKSEGWAIFREMVNEEYGPVAFEQKVDAAMGELRPGDDERAVITQIRAAFKAVRGVLDLPGAKLRQVEQATKKSSDRFAHLRRIVRPA